MTTCYKQMWFTHILLIINTRQINRNKWLLFLNLYPNKTKLIRSQFEYQKSYISLAKMDLLLVTILMMVFSPCHGGQGEKNDFLDLINCRQLDGFIVRDINDCSRFKLCEFGQGIVFQCAPGLAFDHSERNCIQGDLADCHPPSLRVQIPRESRKSPVGESIEYIANKFTPCPSPDGNFGIKGLCGEYLQCEGDFQRYLNCPASTVFDPEVNNHACIHRRDARRSDCTS